MTTRSLRLKLQPSFDNVTINRGSPSIKFGGGFNVIRKHAAFAFSPATFSSVAVMSLRATETNPRLLYVESFCEPEIITATGAFS